MQESRSGSGFPRDVSLMNECYLYAARYGKAFQMRLFYMCHFCHDNPDPTVAMA